MTEAAGPMKVLLVGSPFAPIRDDTDGGAEQVAAMLDAGLSDRGHQVSVVAPAGSKVLGRLYPTPSVTGLLDDETQVPAQERHRLAIREAIARERPDVVHFHGDDFHRYLPPPGIPVLVTLHRAPGAYPAAALRPDRPRTWLCPVSAAQRRAFGPGLDLLEPLRNGVVVERAPPDVPRDDYVLGLGRICPGKSFHEALDATLRAGFSFALAGRVHPRPGHDAYWERELAPRIDGVRARFLGAVGGSAKWRLVAGARCVAVPGRGEETSSLAALEAMACGTPVVAYATDALAGIVDHGRTGFLVRDVPEMVEAIRAVDRLDPEVARRTARERWNARTMVDRYEALYRRVRTP